MVLNDSHAKVFLSELEVTLRRELLKTWRDQGHYMDGSIVDTAEFIIKKTKERLSFLLYIFPYGGFIEAGVSAKSVPFSGTGNKGGTSKYIQALISYAKKKMSLPEEKAKGVAFAIAHTQKKEGMPTSGSYKFSKTGERTGWIQDTMDRNRAYIEVKMYEYVNAIYQVQFDNMITKYQQLFKETK